jgi:AcrR family transcriptional regulator
VSPRPSVEAKRREEVLAATCAIIGEVGFRHVRIADVAERIGTSTGIIHYYFRTKDELLEAAFRFVIETARARSLAALEGVTDPEERLLTVIRVNLPTASNHQDWPIWIHLWAEALRDPSLRRVSVTAYDRWVRLIEDIVREGQEQGAFTHLDAREFATQLLAMIDGLVIQALISGRPTAMRALRPTVESFLRQALSTSNDRPFDALLSG